MKLDTQTVGTFLYPPNHYENLADYVDFWANVEIPDAILSNIRVGYDERVEAQLISAGVTWGHRYDAKNEKALHSTSPSRKASSRVERDAAYAAMAATFYLDHPVHIREDDARSVAMAGQAFHFANRLQEQSEIDELVEYTVTVAGYERTISDTVGIYQLNQLRDSFDFPEITAMKTLEDIRQELRAIQGAD